MKLAFATDMTGPGNIIPEKFQDAECLVIIDDEDENYYKTYLRDDVDNIFFAKCTAENECELIICGLIEKEAFEIIADACVTRYYGGGLDMETDYNKMVDYRLDCIADFIGGTGCSDDHSSCDCEE